jgi:ribose transport system substrate-binding protein
MIDCGPQRRRLSRAAARQGLIAAALVAFAAAVGAAAPERRYTVAFANATEEPGVSVEGTGFTGAEIRQSFLLAARTLPIDLVFYDNRGDDARAIANAEAAIARKVDLYVQYHRGSTGNAAVAQKLKAAGIPVLAVNVRYPARRSIASTTRRPGASPAMH